MVRLLFFSLWIAAHPVHVSLLSIDYMADQKKFQVFLRVYYDDFLLDSGIKSTDQKTLSFSGGTLSEKDILAKYVNEKIKISVNKKQMTAEVDNIDVSENELRMNLFFSSSGKINSITVKNLIMTSLYSDQANMIIVKVNDFEEGIKLTSEEPEKTFVIN
jgi:hypothetical protein